MGSIFADQRILRGEKGKAVLNSKVNWEVLDTSRMGSIIRKELAYDMVVEEKEALLGCTVLRTMWNNNTAVIFRKVVWKDQSTDSIVCYNHLFCATEQAPE